VRLWLGFFTGKGSHMKNLKTIEVFVNNTDGFGTYDKLQTKQLVMAAKEFASDEYIKELKKIIKNGISVQELLYFASNLMPDVTLTLNSGKECLVSDLQDRCNITLGELFSTNDDPSFDVFMETLISTDLLSRFDQQNKDDNDYYISEELVFVFNNHFALEVTPRLELTREEHQLIVNVNIIHFKDGDGSLSRNYDAIFEDSEAFSMNDSFSFVYKRIAYLVRKNLNVFSHPFMNKALEICNKVL
jgi:hypothetical protein